MRGNPRGTAAVWIIAAIGMVAASACAAQTVEELRQLTIEELANIEITCIDHELI